MRILLVEDEQSTHVFLKKALEAESFIVDGVFDGAAGSYKARTNDYDLVILDNMLPEKTGIEVCREIRTAGKRMAILVLSVASETLTKVELLNSGADDYLTKPFSFKELSARIRALGRRPQQVGSNILEVADLSLDVVRHKVIRGKEEIYLTRKEFELLEYLMRNFGIVLSRGMIMEHVWDMDADPFSNTIETHILKLRRKIEQTGRRKLIHTLPCRGYKMDTKRA